MKIKKLLTILSLILISACSLLGCATIESIRVINPDLSIMDKLVITLDREKLGDKYDDVRNSVQYDLETFRGHVESWIDSFRDEYYLIYETLNDGITCEVLPSLKQNELSVVIEFAGIEYFRAFYGLEANTEELKEAMASESYYKAMEDIGPFVTSICNDDYKTEGMGLFLYKYYMFSEEGILKQMQDFSVDGNNYYNEYTSLTGYTLDDVEVNQIFAYPDDRIKSNADVVEVLDGMTLMQWNLSDKSEDFEISIYYIAAQSTAWYVLALMISLVAVVVIFIILKIKHSKGVAVHITKQDVERDER